MYQRDPPLIRQSTYEILHLHGVDSLMYQGRIENIASTSENQHYSQ